MSIKSSEYPIDKVKMPEDNISVTLIASDGLPVVSLSVTPDISGFIVLKNLSSDLIRYAGLSYATVMLFRELTGGLAHNHTIMEGEKTKVIIATILDFTVLTVVPNEFNDKKINKLLEKSVKFWLEKTLKL